MPKIVHFEAHSTHGWTEIVALDDAGRLHRIIINAGELQTGRARWQTLPPTPADKEGSS